MAFILFLAFLLFGPRKLPEIAKQVGKALNEFRRASNELKATFDREVENLEREKEALQAPHGTPPDRYRYGYDYDSGASNAASPYAPPPDATLTPGDGGVPPLPGTAPEGTVSTSAPAIAAPEPVEAEYKPGAVAGNGASPQPVDITSEGEPRA
ncbi:MAG: twin-arginine translocase TatA/TatE family subunit [Bryobacteraceae bacterium]